MVFCVVHDFKYLCNRCFSCLRAWWILQCIVAVVHPSTTAAFFAESRSIEGEHNGGPKLGRKLGDRVFDLLDQFIPHRPLFRPVVLRPCNMAVVLADILRPTLPPQMLVGRIDDDAVEPRRKPGMVAERTCMLKDLHKHILRNIVGRRLTQNHAIGRCFARFPDDAQPTGRRQ